MEIRTQGRTRDFRLWILTKFWFLYSFLTRKMSAFVWQLERFLLYLQQTVIHEHRNLQLPCYDTLQIDDLGSTLRSSRLYSKTWIWAKCEPRTNTRSLSSLAKATLRGLTTWSGPTFCGYLTIRLMYLPSGVKSFTLPEPKSLTMMLLRMSTVRPEGRDSSRASAWLPPNENWNCPEQSYTWSNTKIWTSFTQKCKTFPPPPPFCFLTVPLQFWKILSSADWAPESVLGWDT